MEPVSLREKIAAAFSAAYACPYNANNPQCAALPLRTRPIAERMQVLRGMAEEELDELLSAHETCKQHWRQQINRGTRRFKKEP
ncbi:MAG: hypothetical protein ACYTGH_20040 [Planctomycetota bacterium]